MLKCTIAIFAATLCALTTSAHAQTIGSLVGTIENPNTVEPAIFGWQLEVTEDYILAAEGGYRYATSAGTVYVFDTKTKALLTELRPSVVEEDAFFGYSMIVRGNLALVSAVGEDAGGDDLGAAYLFELPSGELLHRFTQEPGDDNEFFGEVMDLSGSYALIGANRDDVQQRIPGTAYLFDLSSGELVRRFDGENIDRDFAIRVAVTDSKALIFGVAPPLSLFTYELPAGNLLSQDVFFADSICRDGNHVLIGQTAVHAGGSSGVGNALLYTIEPFVQVGQFFPADAPTIGNFGEEISFDGASVLVNASDEIDGWVYYLGDAEAGSQLVKIISTGEYEFGRAFGADVQGEIAYIHARSTNPATPLKGVIRLYSASGAPCLGDCDGSSNVDFSDLINMLFLFNTPLDPSSQCDADQSGMLDFNDLIAALFAFGPCS